MKTRLVNQACKRIADALIEYGYTTVTTSNIKDYFSEWKQGKEATDVVGMFAENEFNNEEYRVIFGTPDKVVK